MELMRLSASKILSNSWKQEMVITDIGVETEILQTGSREKKSLPYEKIAQVVVRNGALAATLELVNIGGSDNITLTGVNKKEAAKAKTLIESKINPIPGRTPINAADEIKKFKELLDSGAITQEEFDAKKKQLLGI
jgi:hypothetical protein